MEPTETELLNQYSKKRGSKKIPVELLETIVENEMKNLLCYLCNRGWWMEKQELINLINKNDCVLYFFQTMLNEYSIEKILNDISNHPAEGIQPARIICPKPIPKDVRTICIPSSTLGLLYMIDARRVSAQYSVNPYTGIRIPPLML